jgi:hypothetical protein
MKNVGTLRSQEKDSVADVFQEKIVVANAAIRIINPSEGAAAFKADFKIVAKGHKVPTVYWIKHAKIQALDLLELEDFKGYLDIFLPWSTDASVAAKLDPECPRISAILPIATAEEMSLLTTSLRDMFFCDVLSRLIKRPDTAPIEKLTGLALHMYDNVDTDKLADLPDEVLHPVEDALESCRALRTLCCPTPHEDGFKIVRKLLAPESTVGLAAHQKALSASVALSKTWVQLLDDFWPWASAERDIAPEYRLLMGRISDMAEKAENLDAKVFKQYLAVMPDWRKKLRPDGTKELEIAMRDYLRKNCGDILVKDAQDEGHCAIVDLIRKVYIDLSEQERLEKEDKGLMRDCTERQSALSKATAQTKLKELAQNWTGNASQFAALLKDLSQARGVNVDEETVLALADLRAFVYRALSTVAGDASPDPRIIDEGLAVLKFIHEVPGMNTVVSNEVVEYNIMAKLIRNGFAMQVAAKDLMPLGNDMMNAEECLPILEKFDQSLPPLADDPDLSTSAMHDFSNVMYFTQMRERFESTITKAAVVRAKVFTLCQTGLKQDWLECTPCLGMWFWVYMVTGSG